jgi:hypothetical protein
MKWEYCIASNPDIDKLNDLGFRGWELVAIQTMEFEAYSAAWYIFKRPLALMPKDQSPLT